GADLAMLSASADPKGIAYFRSGTSGPADAFVAIAGYPDQGFPPLEPILTKGTLLRAADPSNGSGNIFFRADVRQGNSGGPIFDSTGSVIGIVRAKVDTVRTFRETGRDIENVGIGTDLRVLINFLRSNHVSYHEASNGGAVNDQELSLSASKLVVR